MNQLVQFLLGISLLFAVACTTQKPATEPIPTLPKVTDDQQIEFTILAMNDVYEIAPLGGGTVGGMARVATIRKELRAKNSNTLTLHAGDFLNPSLLGNLRYEGKKIKGRQMVEAMNAAGVQLVTFGNHEFDISRDELQARINESHFNWVSCNVNERLDGGDVARFRKDFGPETDAIPEYIIWEIIDKDSTRAKIGVLGVTLPFDVKDYTYIEDPVKAVEYTLPKLAHCDVIIALTHLDWADDVKLANAFPEIDLIVGGHDHYAMHHKTNHASVTKADANAKSVYIHEFQLNKQTDAVAIESTLKQVDTSVAFDSLTQRVVDKWNAIAEVTIEEAGFDPYKVVATFDEPLDGREVTIRSQQTNMGALITNAMIAASENKATMAFFNGGSVRLDDFLKGDITETDIMRVMPFGGSTYDIEIKGSLLKRVLDTGLANKGSGGYLQWGNISFDETNQTWLINQKPLEDGRTYKAITSDFLLSGREKGLDFLTRKHPDIQVIDHPEQSILRDIRLGIVKYIKEKM